MKRVAISAAILLMVLISCSPTGIAETVVPPERQPVVVELFTSQGCSSCPPANANLITLATRDDVLALSFNVTYWDYLGWKDVFARPEYTRRQVTYEPKLGQRGPFTPQMVVDGRESAVGFDLAEVRDLIGSSPRKRGPALTLAEHRVDVAEGSSRTSNDVWLVWYDPTVVQVPVRRGENSGRTLPHSHVVHSLLHLGNWNGAAATFQTPIVPAGMKIAVIIQESGGGPVVAAATN